jgi:hypothetical protein
MAIEDINIGSVPNDGTGDTLRDGAEKINNNNADFQSQIDNIVNVEETPATIKTKYESNANTNAFNDIAKQNLANQSGINTGDETTATIQSKRPLKTVNGETLEGTGNIPFPSANGDMLKSVYDVNDDGIVDKAQSVIFKAEISQSVQKGNLVYAVGRNPVTNNPIAGLADNTVSFADKTIGMALESGVGGSVIEIVKNGVIEDIDTSLFSVGETVYLSTNGTFDQKSNITSGIFNPVGFVVLSSFGSGAIIIDTSATESIDTDNTINNSNVTGRTVTDALNNLNNASGGVQTVSGQSVDNTDPLNPIINIPLYKSVQADLSRANQTTIALANQQANTFEEYFQDSFTPNVTDNFKVSIRWKWSCDVTQASAIFRVTFSDGVNPDIELITRIEPKDSAGTGEVVNILTGGVITGNVNTGTSERLVGIEVADVILNQGTSYNLKLEWTNENANTDTTVYSSTIRWEQKTQNF